MSGRICNDLRTSLTPEHVEEQSCNYYWKREELNYEDQRGDARLKVCTKFATLSISMQLIPPVPSTEDNEALEDSTTEIAENMAVANARKHAIATETLKVIGSDRDADEEA